MPFDLSDLNICIAVTGLKTGDNPQPGVPVIRCLRKAGFRGKIIGLVYDALESGIYVDSLADEIYQIPYPSAGAEAFLNRLDTILSRSAIDVIIPTLDSEIITYIRLNKELEQRGIHTFLPDEEHYLLRDKTRLASYFPDKGIKVPRTILINDSSQIMSLDQSMSWPVFIKGRYYEAFKAYTVAEALHYYQDICNRWGMPVIAQQVVSGDEFNVVIIGDGKGGMIGMVPQRKLVITDKGKGFGGVVVKNAGLDKFAADLMRILRWRGACELEIIKGMDNAFYLIEINPRFPAWVRLAEGAGQNQPAALVMLALGRKVDPLPPYRPGTLFIRHAEDVISDIQVMGGIAALGELINRTSEHCETSFPASGDPDIGI
ncbi:MAG: biotin carboxylase [Candidatus Cloacimonetes bacterium]|nr:biotin carboxylase [Candidatus Cloacimonadota bacterium]